MNNEFGYEEFPTETTVDQNTQDLVDQIQESVEEAAPVEVKPKKDNSVERNFRELREKSERIERDKERIERENIALRAEIQQKSAPKEQELDMEFANVDDNELIEGKVLKKYVKNFERKIEDYQRKQQQTMAEQQQITTGMMLKAQFPDFDSVVNNESIAKLEAEYPEVLASLHNHPDAYTKLSGAYKVIKGLNIYDPNEAQYEEDKSKAQKNAKRPKAAASMGTQTGTTPLQQANDYGRRYSQAMDAQLRAEVESATQR